MALVQYLRRSTMTTLRSTIPSVVLNAVRRPLGRSIFDFSAYGKRLRGKTALEIGGPTPYFDDHGILPVYALLATVDNCQFSPHTIWTGDVAKNFQYHRHRPAGNQFICDATQLNIPKQYECLLSSHCLEHIANPIRALLEWKRILADDGFLLMLLPHKEATFDWRRSVTPLQHLIEDFENCTTEDDTTHFDEILKLHDLSKTPEYTARTFRERCVANSTHRAMHQHVFITESALALLDYAGFAILEVDAVRPAHIVILAQKAAGENRGMFAPDASWRKRSVFTSDKFTHN
jgi:SAM-dependent methyltransferase